MALVSLEEPKFNGIPAFLEMGFRPFFLGAALFSVIAILLWMALYLFQLPLYRGPATPFYWHGHEMVFGYASAVIAGFLLTAVNNWTGIQTLEGYPLLGLFAMWLMARLLFVVGDLVPVWLAGVFDCGFLLLLLVALSIPVARVRRWRDTAILSKILLLLVCNLVFYLGMTGSIEDGQRIGLYGGMYLILAMVFTIARRVIPFFIEKGVGDRVTLRNSLSIDLGSLFLFLAFAIVDLLGTLPQVAAWLALLLFVLHAVRLWYWHHKGIWSRPLLWVLYIAYIWIVLGFLLKVAAVFAGLSPFLSLHAFVYGGIGLITLGMMSRVILGHTGRSVFAPPPAITWSFLLLALGAVMRVGLPLIDSVHYQYWVGASQLLWVAAFIVFLYCYSAMLTGPALKGPGVGMEVRN